jgi:hypothetical protein
MPRVRRTALPDGIFHVTARGVDGTPIVRDDVDRIVFLRTLAAAAKRYGWRVHVFCLMGTTTTW